MRKLFSRCLVLFAGALMLHAAWAQETILVEDEFNGIAAGEVFPTGDGVGLWNQGTNAIPGGSTWQSNQTGPKAPDSDGAGNITLVGNTTWDQYMDNRTFGQTFDDAQNTFLIVFLTINNANLFVGWADVSMTTPRGVGLKSSDGSIKVSTSATGNGTATPLTFTPGTKFGLKLTRIPGGNFIRVAKHALAGGTAAAKNPNDAGWVDAGSTFGVLNIPDSGPNNIMINAISGGTAPKNIVVDYVKESQMAGSGPTPTPTPSPTPISGPITLIEDDFVQAAGDVFTTGDGVGKWDVSTGGTPQGGQWQANQTGPIAPVADGVTNLTFGCNSTWDQYTDSRNMAQIFDDANDVVLIGLLTLNNADIFFGFANPSFNVDTNGGAGLFSSNGAVNFTAGTQDGTGTATGLTIANNVKFGIKVTRVAGGHQVKIAKHSLASGNPKNPLDPGWVDSGQSYTRDIPGTGIHLMFNSIGGGGTVKIDYAAEFVVPPGSVGPPPNAAGHWTAFE